MTRRGKMILLATVVLYLAGASNASQPAYAFASALLGILLGAYVLSRLSASGLRLTVLDAPRTVQAKRQSALEVEVSNPALLPKPRARLRGALMPISFPGDPEEINLRLPTIPRGVTARAPVPIEAPWRGMWCVEDLRLEGSDPLGIYERPERKLEDLSLIATPAHWESVPLPWMALLTPASRQRMAAVRPDLGDFRSIREYAAGDDLRRVHWPATAHRSTLMIKEYDQPSELQVHVMLAAIGPDHGADAGAELAISVATTLARVFVDAGVTTVLRATALPVGAQGPGRGDFFWRQLVTSLGEMRYSRPEEVPPAASHWADRVPPGSSAYVVSNSAAALAAMHDALGRYAEGAALYTGDPGKPAPGAIVVESFEDIPEALVRVGKGHGYTSKAQVS